MVIPSRYYPIYVWLEITGSSGILWINGFIGDKLSTGLPWEMYRDGEVTGFTNIRLELRLQLRRRGPRLRRGHPRGAVRPR